MITPTTRSKHHIRFYGREEPPRVSADPIMRSAKAAQEAQLKGKRVFNATLGCALDDEGKYTSPGILVETARDIITGPEAANKIVPYTRSSGLPKLAEESEKFFIGSEIIDELKGSGKYLSTVIANGGTSAIATALQTVVPPKSPVITTEAAWPGYNAIAQVSNYNLQKFALRDAEGKLNEDALRKAIDNAIKNSPDPERPVPIILNTPYANPDGDSISQKEMARIADIIGGFSNKRFLIIFDTAYADFGKKKANQEFGPQNEVHPLAFLNEFMNNAKNADVIVASSFSKAFGAYGARKAPLTLITNDKQVADDWSDITGGIIRGTYSSADTFWQNVLLKILESPSSVKKIREWQAGVVKMIDARRKKLTEALQDAHLQYLKLIEPKFAGGFFTSFKILPSAPLNYAAKLIDALKKRNIFIPLIGKDILRVATCAISSDQIEPLAEGLREAATEAARS